MKYEVKWTDTALRQLKKLGKPVCKQIIEKIEKIVENPFLFVKRLKELPFYSLRVGDYRVIMSIDGKNLVVFVLEVGHRRKIYKKFS
jgi:mRNA interferase RelE/StbE